MSVDLDSLLQRLEGARNRGNGQVDVDEDYDPFASSIPTTAPESSFLANGRNTSHISNSSAEFQLGGYGNDVWRTPVTGGAGWAGPQFGSSPMWPAQPVLSATQHGLAHIDPSSSVSKLRSDHQRNPAGDQNGIPSPHGGRSAGSGHLPSAHLIPNNSALQLTGMHPQQQYPSPQASSSPLNPARITALPQQLTTGQGETPAILVNGALSKATPGKKSGLAEDDFGDDDDAWIDSAIAEMNDVQATGQPEPPGRRTSPYFLHNAVETQPEVQMPQERGPPSRTPSAAQVRFPKLGPPPEARRLTSSPVNIPAPPVELPTPVETPDPSAPSRFVKKGSVPRVPVYALDSVEERALFSFMEFNDMQSTIFNAAYKTDENMVVSAPTGSGKTTVFELAFLRMLQFKSLSFTPLAIYMAPTKALCSERVSDWKERFKRLEVLCIELTGDTEVYNIHKYTENVDLIVTTPEKWDSVTRRAYMSPIQNRLCLMMIDEIHTLNEERGATLEVVVSRMKKRGDALRFVAVSATVPNIDDVARWIGSKQRKKVAETTEDDDDDEPMPPPVYDDIEQIPKALVFKFGDEFRPVPLKLHAIGVDAPNEFALGGKLDKELFPVLNRHSDGLPTLVFCPTRKACQSTAEHLYKEYQNALTNRTRLPWDPSENQRVILKDAKIQKWTETGIAIHHAGLDLLDRRNIEQAFRNSKIHLLVATSTLAVGVNLPAHLVVIKGTSCWAGQGFREYSDIDIQQMMGRAGRPQFDTSGTVVIMCNKTKLHKYQAMMNSKTILESCLHQHLTEHLNSEIGLGTIGSLQSAQDWLRGTFLSIRIRQNPKLYQGTMIKDHANSWDVTLDRFVENAVLDLKKHEFVTDDVEVIKEQTEEGHTPKELIPTSLGKVMSQNCISYKTMCHIITMDKNSGMREVLEILAGATEFSSLRIRQGEGALFNKLRISSEIRFNLDQAKTYADKVFLLLQVAFGNVSLDEFATKTENTSPLQTQLTIFNAAPRIARAIFAVACHKKYGGAALAALELCHTVNGKAWEDSPTIFRQIEKIGPKSITVLASNGIASFDDFIQLDPGRLEMWLNRHPPFGHEVIERAKDFPRFSIEFLEEGVGQDESGFPTIQLRLQIKNSGQLVHKPQKSGGLRSNAQNRRTVTYNLIILTLSTKDNRFLDYRSINTGKLNDRVREFPIEVTLYDPKETIVCVAGVEEKSGLSRTFEYKPRIPEDQFPKREDIVARFNGTQATRTADKRPQPARPADTDDSTRRSKSPLFLGAEFSDIEELSDDDELIDLTAPKDKKSKKRRTSGGMTAASKKRKFALAVKSFIDDEAIDDDEDEEEEYSEDDDGFIDMGDQEPAAKSSRSSGKSAAGRSETQSSRRKAPTWATDQSGDKAKSSSSAKSSARTAVHEGKASKSKSVRDDAESSLLATTCDPDRARLEDIPGYDATLLEPSMVPAPGDHPEDLEPKQTVEDQFNDWFGEFFE